MSEKQWVHFIGIGGAGMSGIAKVLLELGYKISGSDLQASEIIKRLQDMGALIRLGHSGDNIQDCVNTVVVSSAIPSDNPEVVKAKELKIPVIQRAEMLARLMARQKGIGVAGAHGKTTTSSLVSLMFEKNGYDPTVVVGGEVNDIGGNAKLGKGEYLVAEADESDGSFLKLDPYITVVTNVEDDHLDFYGSRSNIEQAFFRFISGTPQEGFTVLNLDDPVLGEMIKKLPQNIRVVTYGFTEAADFWAKDVSLQGTKSKATIVHNGRIIGFLELNVPGKHNIMNALAAIAVGTNCGLGFKEIADSLRPFQGVQRRFQKIGEISGIDIYDDYAHHPTELKATLAAAKTLYSQRLIAVFQPHRYSRTKLLAHEFGSAFVDADILIVNEIYAAGEKPIAGVNAGLIVDSIRSQVKQDVEYIEDKKNIVPRLLNIVKPGDCVITLGAGNIWEVGTDLLQMMQMANAR